MVRGAALPLSPEELAAAGVEQAGVLPTGEIPFSPEVRRLCAENLCGGYGSRWTCPPARGTYEAAVEECRSYARILVFSTAFPIDDEFDLDGMRAAMRRFKDVCDRLHDMMAERAGRFLVLSNEGCFRCGQCTYPHKPCRFPDRLHPSIEGFGILVGELAKRAGLRYQNGGSTVTYFGGVLY